MLVQSHDSGRQLASISSGFVSKLMSVDYLRASHSSSVVDAAEVWVKTGGDSVLALIFLFLTPALELTCAIVIPLKLSLIPAVHVVPREFTNSTSSTYSSYNLDSPV